MFEPIEIELDELKIAAYTPTHNCSDGINHLSESDLSEAVLSRKKLDALLVSSSGINQSQQMIGLCQLSDTLLLVFDNPSNDMSAVYRVIDNLIGKLQSHEMPNNLDIVDLRNLSEGSDFLFAFDNHSAVCDFLDAQNLGKVVGGVHLAHKVTELSQYENATDQLLDRFPNTAYLCSSIYSDGIGDSTTVIGIKSESPKY